jgi:hypothetical protein
LRLGLHDVFLQFLWLVRDRTDLHLFLQRHWPRRGSSHGVLWPVGLWLGPYDVFL